MYGFDPNPTHLNASPCDADRGLVLIFQKKNNDQGLMWFSYACRESYGFISQAPSFQPANLGNQRRS